MPSDPDDPRHSRMTLEGSGTDVEIARPSANPNPPANVVATPFGLRGLTIVTTGPLAANKFP